MSLAGAGGVQSKGQCVVTTKEATNAVDGTPLGMHVRTRMDLSGGSAALRVTTRRVVRTAAVRLVIWIACVRQRAVTETLTLHLSSTGHASIRPAVSPGHGVEQAAPRSAVPSGQGIRQAAPRPAASPGQGIRHTAPRSAESSGLVQQASPPPGVSSGHDVRTEVVPVRPAPLLRIAAPASASLPLRLSTVLSAPVPRPTEGQGTAGGDPPFAAASPGLAKGGAQAPGAVAALQERVEALEGARRRLLQQVQDLQAGASGPHAVGSGVSWTALLGYAAFGGALLVFVATIARERHRTRTVAVPSRSRQAPEPRRASADTRPAPAASDHERARAVPERPTPSVTAREGSDVPQGTARQGPSLSMAIDEPVADKGAALTLSVPPATPPPPADESDLGPVNGFLLDELESGEGSNPAMDGEPDEPDLGLDGELDGALESFEQQVQEWDSAVAELHQALYEAELHLLHGSPEEAARILTQQLDSYEAEFLGVRPWTMLFEVYRQQADQASFDALAARFRKRFNVAPPAWDTQPGADSKTGRSLEEQFPHVVEHIMSLWPSSECLGYLNGLLMDDLGGARQGFSLAVAEEIELLRDMIRRRIGQGRDMRSQSAPPGPPEKRSQLS